MKIKAIIAGMCACLIAKLVGLIVLISTDTLLSPAIRNVTIALYYLQVGAGVASVFLGGYVAGRVAKYKEVTQAVIVFIALLGLGYALPLAFPRLAYPQWQLFQVALVSVRFADAVLGGWVAKRRNEKSNHTIDLTAARSAVSVRSS